MPYTAKSIINGERGKQVLNLLKEYGERGSYATEIANEISVRQQNVSEVIKVLKKYDMVEKGKRTRAQYYRITDKGRRFLEIDEEIDDLERQIRSLKVEREELVGLND